LLLAACSTSEARDGATVVLLPRDVQELDPRLTGDAYGHKVSRLLFASLFTIDSQTLSAMPELAESFEQLGPTHYRVRLRPALRFSDGSALDAEDVVATFESVVDPRIGSRYASTYRRIARMRIEDPRTVLFELDGPHATFITDLELPIVRAEDRARAIAALGGPAPIGSGPYVLRERAAGRLELTANPAWYRGQARHTRVRMLVVRDDNTRALRMLAGAGDVAINAIPHLLLPLFEANEAFDVRSAAGAGTTYLGLNLDAPALRDARVRRALALGIDRDALVRTKLAQRARAAQSFLPQGHWAQAGSEALGYDPAQARALLDAAGKRPDADGQRLRIALRCGSDRARISMARAIAAMLADIGVRADLQPTETATLIAALNRGQFELAFMQVPEVIEPHLLSWFFGSDHIPSAKVEGANRWRLRSPALDAALERGRSTTVHEERVAAYTTANRVLHAQLPIIPLWHEDIVAVTRRGVGPLRVSRLGRFDPLAFGDDEHAHLDMTTK
jgi:peptide/nickel transport system substrate-binding protein